MHKDVHPHTLQVRACVRVFMRVTHVRGHTRVRRRSTSAWARHRVGVQSGLARKHKRKAGWTRIPASFGQSIELLMFWPECPNNGRDDRCGRLLQGRLDLVSGHGLEPRRHVLE